MPSLPDLNQVITRDCPIVSPQTRLSDVIRCLGMETSVSMATAGGAASIPCVLAVDGGQLVGLLTAQDVPGLIVSGVNLEQTPMAQAMARSPLSLKLSKESTLLSALEMIQEHGLQYLPVLESDGRVAGVIAADVLYRQLPVWELLQGEAALRESEARFRALYEQAAVGIARVGRLGQLIQVNRAFCRLLGYAEAELLQQTVQQITHPEDRESDRGLMGQLWSGKLPSCNVEKRYLCKDGQVRWADLSVSLVRDMEGDPQYSIEVVQDISDRKQIEAALWESEARLLHLVSASPAVIYTCKASKDYDLTYISYNITEHLGFKPEDFLSQANFWQNCLHPDDLPRVLDERSQLAKQGFQVSEYRLRRQDGVYRWVNDQIRLLRDPDGAPKEMVGCILDITDRKQAEQKLKASLQEKEVLLQEIHHRVKNNLQIISSLLYLQTRAIDDRQACSALQASRSRVESMSLVHESLYQTRDFTHIDFEEYVRKLAKNLLNSYLAETTAISFQARIHPDVTLSLKQALPCGLIVNELISNALKHGVSDESTGQICVALEAQPDNELILSVSNSGDALPADFDLDQSQSMGLALVKALCKQLKGALELERGDSTTFKISFPNPGSGENLRPDS